MTLLNGDKMVADRQLGVDVVDFESADEFLAYLNPNMPHWSGHDDALWVYRGQSDSAWGLQPSAWRADGQQTLLPFIAKFESFRPAVFELFSSRSANAERATDYTLRIAGEYEAVHQFVDLADELGFTIPRQGLLDKEYSGREYLEHVLNSRHLVPFSLPLCFTLAQHHGIPTRLLDWTRSALKAAYFASSSNDDEKLSKSIAVWAIDIGSRKGSTFPHPFQKIVCPRSDHSFLHSQDGLFLAPVYGTADHFFLEHGEWPNVVDQLRNNTRDDYLPLRKITLPYSGISDLKDRLWKHRISKAHLQPSLDYVCGTVLWRAARK